MLIPASFLPNLLVTMALLCFSFFISNAYVRPQHRAEPPRKKNRNTMQINKKRVPRKKEIIIIKTECYTNNNFRRRERERADIFAFCHFHYKIYENLHSITRLQLLPAKTAFIWCKCEISVQRIHAQHSERKQQQQRQRSSEESEPLNCHSKS